MTLTIELPSDLVAKLEGRAKNGGFSDAKEYVRALIDADSADTAAPASVHFDGKGSLQAMLQAGISSGDSGEITAADWETKRQNLRSRFGHGTK
jgi:Arc/MetJ-type ribon-helix-helix transcriptional regulator